MYVIFNDVSDTILLAANSSSGVVVVNSKEVVAILPTLKNRLIL